MMLVLLTVLTAGCAGGGADRPPVDEPLRPTIVADGGAAPMAGLWLQDSLAELGPEAGDCHMLRTALADTAHSWLWLDLDLTDDRYVRVAGPGALVLSLRTNGAVHIVRDDGLCVALGHDANAYLNSSGGPITIRHAHASSGKDRVRILARLPGVDTARTVVQTVTPVEGRWTVK